MSVAQTIIQHLIVTEEYGRKVFPFLVADYFRERVDRVLFEIIADYFGKYNKFPSVQEVAIDLTEKQDVDEIEFDEAKEFLSEVAPDVNTNIDWLIDRTEKFCQDRAVEIAIQQAAACILDEKNSKIKRDAIPQILQDALAVSFETSLGHDFLEDWEERYDFLHSTVSRLPFHIEYLNKITNGGLPAKTLSVILAGTGVGKSLLMCDMAAHNLMDNRNVLYITLELARDIVSQRIESNLFDVELDLLNTLSKADVKTKIERLKKRTTGKLIVEEFPTSGAGAAHFRRLLNDLKTKRGFIPDIIYIDYINICISTRFKSNNANSYTIIKMIAEELRGLAVDFNVPIVTATQTNRGGYSSNDLGLEDTAESFGLPATADFMFSISQDEDMKEMGQVVFKQLKNRFGDVEKLRKWIMGIQKSKMRFLELEASAQRTINSVVEERPNKPPKFVSSPSKEKFAKFNKGNQR